MGSGAKGAADSFGQRVSEHSHSDDRDPGRSSVTAQRDARMPGNQDGRQINAFAPELAWLA